MKNLVKISIVLILCSTAFAVVSMTISVPDTAVSQVWNAMNKLAGTHITLEARGSDPNPENDFNGHWDFRIAPKDPNETNKAFAERFTKELLRASVRLVRQAEEQERYSIEISKIQPPDVNVPDEVVQ